MAHEDSILYNAKYWELRAEEVRTIADTLKDPEAKVLMATVADTYEKMAERAVELRELLRPRPRAVGSGSP
jgi:hypothetical protein